MSESNKRTWKRGGQRGRGRASSEAEHETRILVIRGVEDVSMHAGGLGSLLAPGGALFEVHVGVLVRLHFLPEVGVLELDVLVERVLRAAELTHSPCRNWGLHR